MNISFIYIKVENFFEISEKIHFFQNFQNKKFFFSMLTSSYDYEILSKLSTFTYYYFKIIKSPDVNL
jgi:hypothetical protein